jgi:hypothetical protein
LFPEIEASPGMPGFPRYARGFPYYKGPVCPYADLKSTRFPTNFRKSLVENVEEWTNLRRWANRYL